MAHRARARPCASPRGCPRRARPPRRPPSDRGRRARAPSNPPGKRTRARARAERAVSGFAPTSTIRASARPPASRPTCESAELAVRARGALPREFDRRLELIARWAKRLPGAARGSNVERPSASLLRDRAGPVRKPFRVQPFRGRTRIVEYARSSVRPRTTARPQPDVQRMLSSYVFALSLGLAPAPTTAATVPATYLTQDVGALLGERLDAANGQSVPELLESAVRLAESAGQEGAAALGRALEQKLGAADALSAKAQLFLCAVRMQSAEYDRASLAKRLARLLGDGEEDVARGAALPAPGRVVPRAQGQGSERARRRADEGRAERRPLARAAPRDRLRAPRPGRRGRPTRRAEGDDGLPRVVGRSPALAGGARPRPRRRRRSATAGAREARQAADRTGRARVRLLEAGRDPPALRQPRAQALEGAPGRHRDGQDQGAGRPLPHRAHDPAHREGLARGRQAPIGTS